MTLRFDAERRDVYGRLLAYVYLPAARPGGHPLFVNAELVRRGLARTLTIPPNDSFASLFARLAARAGAQAGGYGEAAPYSQSARSFASLPGRPGGFLR